MTEHITQVIDPLIKQKLERLVTKYPDLRSTLVNLKLEDLRFAVNQLQSQTRFVLISKDAYQLSRLYKLAFIITKGYLHVTELSSTDLLQLYVDQFDQSQDNQSLFSLVDDLIIIKDSRYLFRTKQTDNFIQQVLYQNDNFIYYSDFDPHIPFLSSFTKPLKEVDLL